MRRRCRRSSCSGSTRSGRQPNGGCCTDAIAATDRTTDDATRCNSTSARGATAHQHALQHHIGTRCNLGMRHGCQVSQQFPSRMEFNEPFLLFLVDALYSCRFGALVRVSARLQCNAPRSSSDAGLLLQRLSPPPPPPHAACRALRVPRHAPRASRCGGGGGSIRRSARSGGYSGARGHALGALGTWEGTLGTREGTFGYSGYC